MDQDNLTKCGLDPVLLAETHGWNSSKAKKFVLKKDQCVYIPSGLRIIKMGLGWDTRMDLDANVLLFDKRGQVVS